MPLLWLTAKLALRLGGREALLAGLLLPAFSLITLGEFAPGRFDHHSAQILLTLMMLYCTLVALERPRFAIGAGIAAAAALAIGIEGLPIVAATVMIFGLIWVAAPRHATALRDFGLSFACAMALGLAPGRAARPLVRPAARRDLDRLRRRRAPLRRRLHRPVAAPLRSVAAAPGRRAIVAGASSSPPCCSGLDPAILKGPYAALDPWLVANWMSRIAEAETWLQSFADDPVYPLAVTVPVLVALAFAIWNIVRHKAERGAWLIYAAFLVVGAAGHAGADPRRPHRHAARRAGRRGADRDRLASPRRATRPRARRSVAVGGWLVSAGLAVADRRRACCRLPPPATTVPPTATARPACMPAAFTDLAALPPERIMAPIDLGSHLLLFTPHSVVGAPYHRNQQGVLDTFRFFNGPIDDARTILDARGIGLVVICPAMKEIRGLRRPRAGLVRQRSTPNRPAARWLVEPQPARQPAEDLRRSAALDRQPELGPQLPRQLAAIMPCEAAI